jgi:hypothetical protein
MHNTAVKCTVTCMHTSVICIDSTASQHNTLRSVGKKKRRTSQGLPAFLHHLRAKGMCAAVLSHAEYLGQSLQQLRVANKGAQARVDGKLTSHQRQLLLNTLSAKVREWRDRRAAVGMASSQRRCVYLLSSMLTPRHHVGITCTRTDIVTHPRWSKPKPCRIEQRYNRSAPATRSAAGCTSRQEHVWVSAHRPPLS